MMNSKSMRSVALAAMLAACGSVAWVQAQPGQQSQPAKQNDPGRTNPSQPGRTNPSQPGQTNPSQPGQTNPNDPGRTNPTEPGRTDPNDPGRTNPNDPGRTDPNLRPGDRTTVQPGDTNRNSQPVDRNTIRNLRPFAFESRDAETRFNENGRRLVAFERNMSETNRDLMRKLSEARSLTGPQQNQAILDLMQQILQEHQSLHEYLVAARTGWTGDLESMDSMQRDGADAQRRQLDPSRPSTDATPRNPR